MPALIPTPTPWRQKAVHAVAGSLRLGWILLTCLGLPSRAQFLLEENRDQLVETPMYSFEKQARPELDSDTNYVEDALDSLGRGALVDILIQGRKPLTPAVLDALRGSGTVAYIGKYLNWAMITNITVREAQSLAADESVAFVQANHDLIPAVSPVLQLLKVTPSALHPLTNLAIRLPNIRGQGVTVAVFDSGVDDGKLPNLPASMLVGGFDAATGLEGNPTDSYGHGSYTASLILARESPQNTNVVGVAPEAKLADFRVLSAPGLGVSNKVSQALIAIDKCIQRRFDWNISVAYFGFHAAVNSDGRDLLSQGINRLVKNDVVAILPMATTGGSSTPTKMVPAGPAADDALAVALLNNSGSTNLGSLTAHPWGQLGPRLSDGDGSTDDERKPDLGAPGVDIPGADYRNATAVLLQTGSSASAALVAGVAALARQANPQLSSYDVRKHLIDSARDVGIRGWDAQTGAGTIDPYVALTTLALPALAPPSTDLAILEDCHAPFPMNIASKGLVPADPYLLTGRSNSIRVTVVNRGSNVATRFEVKVGIGQFSNQDPATEICTITVPSLAPGSTQLVYCPYTPKLVNSPLYAREHACLQAAIIYPYDTNSVNDCAQHNVTVIKTSSPAETTFTIKNPTRQPRTLFLRPPEASPEGWSVVDLKYSGPQWVDPGQQLDVTVTILNETGKPGFWECPLSVVGEDLDGNQVSLGGVVVRVYTEAEANRPPTAERATFSFTPGERLTVSPEWLREKTRDPEDDPLTAILIIPPEPATLNMAFDGGFELITDFTMTSSLTAQYVVSDGKAQSGPATIDFVAGPARPASAPTITGTTLEAEKISIRFSNADPGRLYQIDQSTDLKNWEPLTAFTPQTGEETVVGIPVRPGEPSRFLRASWEDSQTYSGKGYALALALHPGSLGTLDLNRDGINDLQGVAGEDGFLNLNIPTVGLPPKAWVNVLISRPDGTPTGPPATIQLNRDQPTTRGQAGTTDLAHEKPQTCACMDEECATCPSPNVGARFDNSRSPMQNGAYLASGKQFITFPLFSFPTRRMGFSMDLHHASLSGHPGEVGNGVSWSWEAAMIADSPRNARFITPMQQEIHLSTADGIHYSTPNSGFNSRVLFLPDRNEFLVTHASGDKMAFSVAPIGCPSRLTRIEDRHGNTISIVPDPQGRPATIITDSQQSITLKYNDAPGPNGSPATGLLSTVTDHLGRTWKFQHDAQGRLNTISPPETDYLQIEPGALPTLDEKDEPRGLVRGSRATVIAYDDPRHPNHITSITDARGVLSRAYSYDAQGRVTEQREHGNPTRIVYNPVSNPVPQPKLEPGNIVTRVIDPEGNVTDREMHGASGGPIEGMGKYGGRRVVQYTASGLGKAALRPGESTHYEERELHDCDCLSPAARTHPMSSEDIVFLDLDPTTRMPKNWPTEVFTRNELEQVETHELTDGRDRIITKTTFQAKAYGDDGQYGLMLTRTDPRALDSNPIYAGLDFTHRYTYDTHGNLRIHDAPLVTRGVEAYNATSNEAASSLSLSSPATSAPFFQKIREEWTHDAFGRETSYTDPNGNRTTYTYHQGPTSGGDINSKGSFGGYRATVIRGDTGSKDQVTRIVETQHVNALGMVTQSIDPKGNVTDYEYNALGERIRTVEPLVTLRNGIQVRYETRQYYDGDGNLVLTRRSNIDYDGTRYPNAFVDHFVAYDDGGNAVAVSDEVDANPTNNIVQRFVYNANDDQIALIKPMGNREFTVYDERRKPFRVFYGIAPGATLTAGYPSVATETNLIATEFVGFREYTYDARGNPTVLRDGRGYLTHSFYNFAGRLTGTRDPNGNGSVTDHDAASHVVQVDQGAVGPTGQITKLLARTYRRYDEAGRSYLETRDLDPSTSEAAQIDPSAYGSAAYRTLLDAGSRTIRSLDANENPTSFTYDAANRRRVTTDALNNEVRLFYDPSSNVTNVTELEVPGPGASGSPELYATTFDFDEVNRKVASHIRGLNGNSLDHPFLADYDSRSNERLKIDAEGNSVEGDYDDIGRMKRTRRWGGDPLLNRPELLQLAECLYDQNGRKTESRAYSRSRDTSSVQTTRYAYDQSNRLIRTVYPDSDDPISGYSDGADASFDRLEIEYDAEGSVITVRDQRGITTLNSYDSFGRLVDQTIIKPVSIPGVDRQQFEWDEINRLRSARNNYSEVKRDYDSLMRQTNEIQSIQMNGTGFQVGWNQPITITRHTDRMGNTTNCIVASKYGVDQIVEHHRDLLSRVDDVRAAYFDQSIRRKATYSYHGPFRLRKKELGNSMRLHYAYDAKRRIVSMTWVDNFQRLLVGFNYGNYDNMDNVGYEKQLHDNGYYSLYGYNKRYELTKLHLRSSTDGLASAADAEWQYDDNHNCVGSRIRSLVDPEVFVSSRYEFNAANELSTIQCNNTTNSFTYDSSGNMVTVGGKGICNARSAAITPATMRYDALGCLYSMTSDTASSGEFRYDALRRRILVDGGARGSRRQIYEGWQVVQEREVTDDEANSRVYKVYVIGAEIDDHLLAVFDGDGDGVLSADSARSDAIRADKEHFLIHNRMGSLMAESDAKRSASIVNYWVYDPVERPVRVPIVDADSDSVEDSPATLTDNLSMISDREVGFEVGIFGFGGTLFDPAFGLLFSRYRYSVAGLSFFVSRDPIGYDEAGNLYQKVQNNPYNRRDIFGLKSSLQCPVGWELGASLPEEQERDEFIKDHGNDYWWLGFGDGWEFVSSKVEYLRYEWVPIGGILAGPTSRSCGAPVDATWGVTFEDTREWSFQLGAEWKKIAVAGSYTKGSTTTESKGWSGREEGEACWEKMLIGLLGRVRTQFEHTVYKGLAVNPVVVKVKSEGWTGRYSYMVCKRKCACACQNRSCGNANLKH